MTGLAWFDMDGLRLRLDTDLEGALREIADALRLNVPVFQAVVVRDEFDEHDPRAAATLRELIRRGVIAPGDGMRDARGEATL